MSRVAGRREAAFNRVNKYYEKKDKKIQAQEKNS